MNNCEYNDISIGAIVSLDRFPRTKWLVCNGWFTNESNDTQNGWYLRAIPSGATITLTQDDMSHLIIVQNGECYFHEHFDPCHVHKPHHSIHKPKQNEIEVYMPGVGYSRGQLVWLSPGDIYQVAKSFKSSLTEGSPEENLQKDLDLGNIVSIDGSNLTDSVDRITETFIDKLFIL